MPKRTNLKAVPDAKPEPLTWHQLDRLDRAVAFELMGEQPEAVRLLLLYMHEIAVHSFDQGHVETATTLMRVHLFAVTPECEAAEKPLIAEERARLAEWNPPR